MKKLQSKLFNQLAVGLTEAKKMKLLWMILLFAGNAEAQSSQDEFGIAQSFTSRFKGIYLALTAVLIAACIFYGLKVAKEALAGEQGAWGKVGAIVVVLIFWLTLPTLVGYVQRTASQATFTN